MLILVRIIIIVTVAFLGKRGGVWWVGSMGSKR